MEIRLLKYFLATAEEGSMSKAAAKLHITQPTLSRQIKNFEEELGTTLFDRDNHMELTAAGLLLKDRALDIIDLVDKTEEELNNQKSDLFGGNISFGCIEGTGSEVFSELVASFHEKYPLVTYDIFTGTGDDITDRIDRGAIDFGIIMEPIELKRYATIPFDDSEVWGIMVHQEHPLADKEVIHFHEIINEPLFIPGRDDIKNRIIEWLDTDSANLNIVIYYKLMSNIASLVEKRIGIAIGTQSASEQYQREQTKFIPFSEAHRSRSILAWKKNRFLTPAANMFITHTKQILST